MEENKIEKPIFISEAGISHTIFAENEVAPLWAVAQLNKLYGEVIRYYPQVKGIIYFNIYIKDINKNNDYALYNSKPMQTRYNELVKSDYFISEFGKNAPFSYKKMADKTVKKGDIINLSAVNYYPYVVSGEVEYYIDDVKTSVKVSPYEFSIDTSKLSSGEHSIKIRAVNKGSVTSEKTYKLIVN